MHILDEEGWLIYNPGYREIFTESQLGVLWWFSNFELLLLVRKSTYVAQILCGLNYNV